MNTYQPVCRCAVALALRSPGAALLRLCLCSFLLEIRVPIHSRTCGDGIAIVTISKPHRRNALDLEMFQSLAELWVRLERDPQVRSVVLRGDGPDAFCSGADLNEHLDRRTDIDPLIDRALLKSHVFCKPLVAAIEGACVAGGLELALAADIRVAAANATLGLPEVRWGIVPSGGGALKLCDQIGHARAMDLLLTGRLIDGVEAERIGLVSRVAQAADVWPESLALAKTLCENSLSAMVATKRIAHERRSSDYRAWEPVERRLVAMVRETGDPEEGKAAFLERRKAQYGNVSDELILQSPAKPDGVSSDSQK